jgi:hypothetical protein
MSYPNEPPLPEFKQHLELEDTVGLTIKKARSYSYEIAILFTDGSVFFEQTANDGGLSTTPVTGLDDLLWFEILTQEQAEERRAAQADWDRRCREGAERTEYLKLRAKFEGSDK